MKHHTIDYIEFPALNIDEIKAFYAQTFGWSFTDYGAEYTSFEDNRLSGGFFKSKKVVESSPLVVIYSEKLEDTYKKVVDNGGKIVKEIFEFPGGRRFHFKDPSGNTLAAWSE